MITPTRFGLKYNPIPTIALEYEESLLGIEDDSGTRSLYVYKENENQQRKMTKKKVHVIELPQLTTQSEPKRIAEQLQRDNSRFLGPNLVKEEQLRRLLELLIAHVSKNQAALQMESSVNKRSHIEDMESPSTEKNTALSSSHGKFISQVEHEDTEDHQEMQSASNEDRDDSGGLSSVNREVTTDDQASITEKNREESDADDDEEVQSEELEYFSEEAEDDDSF